MSRFIQFQNQCDKQLSMFKLGGEVMKSEFENWHSNSKDKSTSSAFAAGWMCQQSKVDELERIIELRDQQLTEEIALSTKYVGKFDELQKRVDAALKLIPSLKSENDLWGCEQVERQIELLEQALKGGGE